MKIVRPALRALLVAGVAGSALTAVAQETGTTPTGDETRVEEVASFTFEKR